jgi:hypothetical protein
MDRDTIELASVCVETGQFEFNLAVNCIIAAMVVTLLGFVLFQDNDTWIRITVVILFTIAIFSTFCPLL